MFGANTPHPLRGSEAIVAGWRDIIPGTHVHLSWYPTQVVMGDAGDLAYFSGPWLLENTSSGAAPRYLRGHFAAVWRGAPDGQWRVLFAGGDAGAPSDAVGAAAFDREGTAACPAPEAAFPPGQPRASAGSPNGPRTSSMP